MPPTTALHFATLFNATAVGTALIVCLLLRPRVRAPFFDAWTHGYAWAFGTAVATLWSGWFGPDVPALLLQACCGTLASGLFVRTGRILLGRATAMGWPEVGIGAAFAAYLLGLALGWPHEAYAGPGALALAASMIWLGSVMLKRGEGAGWHGLPLILHGLWLFGYPLLAATGAFWIGFWGSGITNSLVGVGVAIYALERQARALSEKNTELEKLDRLKQGFLSTVSHELRTPLTSLTGYLELMEDGVGGRLNPSHRAYVKDMQASTGQLTELVDALLDSAQLEAGELDVKNTPTAIAPLVERTLAPFRGLLEARGLALALDVPDGLPMALADDRRVGQVLNNMVGNAAKFTPAGGSITVRVRRVGERLRVEVQDTGPGVREAERARLFEPFFRGDDSLTRTQRGTGLGLAIARHLVTAMGGEIGVESEPGRGSTFWFTLPSVAERADDGIRANG